MARDTEKNFVFTGSIPRDSFLFKMLAEDAKDTNISLSKLLVLRAKDFYRGSKMPAASSPSDEGTFAAEDDEQNNNSQSALNAEDAFDAW